MIDQLLLHERVAKRIDRMATDEDDPLAIATLLLLKAVKLALNDPDPAVPVVLRLFIQQMLNKLDEHEQRGTIQ